MHLQDVHKTYSDLEVLEVKFTDIQLSPRFLVDAPLVSVLES